MSGIVEALWTMAAGPYALAALAVAALAALAVGVWLGRATAHGCDPDPPDPEVPVHVREYLAESDRLHGYAALLETSGEFGDPDFKERIQAAALSIADAESGCYDRRNPIPDPEG